jgi:hypothetical protein
MSGGQAAASSAQQGFNYIWRKTPLKGSNFIKHIGVSPWEETLSFRSKLVEIRRLPASSTPTDASLAHKPIAFECRKVRANSVVGKLQGGGQIFHGLCTPT